MSLMTLGSFALLGLLATSQAAMEPTPLSEVRLEGELGARYQAATYNLVTRTDVPGWGEGVELSVGTGFARTCTTRTACESSSAPTVQ